MKSCAHTRWLKLCHLEGDMLLAKSNRLARLIDQLPNQDELNPSLCVFVGNKIKSRAIRHAFGIRQARLFRNRRRSGELHLNVDPSTVYSERPVLVADGTVGEPPERFCAAKDKCHIVDNMTLAQSSSASLTLSNIYGVISPFTDVYCLFATDIGGFRQVACVVAAWLQQTPFICPSALLPQLMVVTDKIPSGKRSEEEAKRALLSLIAEETKIDVFAQFSVLDVVSLPRQELASAAQFSLLKSRVIQASNEVRCRRQACRMLFSAVHFNAFFDLACDHFSKNSSAPFNFIRASRVDNPIAEDLAEHVTNLIRLVQCPDALLNHAIPMIASSLLLDSYPPDAHVFSPRDIFSTLYHDTFSRVGEGRVIAFENPDQIMLRAGFIKLVRESFQENFERWLQNTETTAVKLHLQNMSRFWDYHKPIHSTRTCLSCLRREPSICLPGCKHCICETCVELFVDPGSDDLFRIRYCFCCGTEMPEDVVVKIHPPTTGVGLLCIDGGGAKGVVPLRIMQLIEAKLRELIEADIPVQTFFKVGFGVSIGALILAATFLKGFSTDESAGKIRTLAKIAFQDRSRLPIFSRARKFARFCLGDGIYPSGPVERISKELFGSDTSILDSSYATSIGTKLGFPVATVDQRPSSRIFSNYTRTTATGQLSVEEDVIRPPEGFGRVLLWQIARAVSAAPGIFPPQHIPMVGTLQDHGPLENDPVISAMTEVTKLYPHIHEPDFILSLGTGEPSQTEHAHDVDEPRQKWNNAGLLRLGRLAWEKSRDKKARQIFQNNPRYFRLDVKTTGTEPRLDSLESMDTLESLVSKDDSLVKLSEDFARRAVGSLFYFELAQKTDCFGDKHEGHGYILCKLGPSHPAFQPLMNYLERIAAKFYLNDDLVASIRSNGIPIGPDGRFRLSVKLLVDDKFAIMLRQGDNALFHISASPLSVIKLETLQGLTAFFGRPNHRKRQRSPGHNHQPSKKLCR